MNWKTEIATLRTRATSVLTAQPVPTGMAPREVARVLSGVTSVLARRHGVEAMQGACAVLALDDRAWTSRLAVLPREPDGTLNPCVEMIAVICRGILSAGSLESVRAAVSFWASESDPAVWQQVVAA